jgi:putative FmdB family regulatory protein
MPIYEYKCESCGHVTEFIEASGADAEHACEECGSTRTEKVLSTFSTGSNSSDDGTSCCPTGTCSLS